MPKLEDERHLRSRSGAEILPITVIVAVRNEARNLPHCLESLQDVGEAYVIDSQSTDGTIEIARSHGAQVVQFHYRGGWPKKRQWAMETLPLAYDWILLLDADESLTAELSAEIRQAIENPAISGYYISLRMYFLGRLLRHGGAGFWKLSLFRRGKGGYECRLRNQDSTMADMEVHEHVVVEGATARLKNPLVHRNVESLSRYIQKHDEYSNWEANVWAQGEDRGQLSPALFGTQAQRRRWLKKNFLRIPGAPVLFFVVKYVLGLGFLDGVPGLIYCGFQAVQVFHVKSKIYELRRAAKRGKQ
ncbi:MAG TPA: glycosyltransferase family 2 protein [Candidatus Sulfotelmatobacter sp.]|jgi:glycosyltransferase involved in cell wall biosynthesis|nr:glycosyltransferase family 2 protein [Candidatus Sulfotelmatobacter sp.]